MKLSVRRAILFYTLIPIVVIYIIFAVENINQTRHEVHERIKNHMTDLAYSYAQIFNGILNPVSSIAKTTADILRIDGRLQESEIYQLLTQQVENNPIIYGAWIAFAPYQFDETRKFAAPYVFRDQQKGIIAQDFGKYDYTDGRYEFWDKPVAEGKGVWTEPYFAKVGHIMMSSFVVPVYRNGKLLGVAGIDIPLHKINESIEIPGVRKNNLMVLSANGNIILFPDKQFIGESIFKLIDEGLELVTDKPTGTEDKLKKSHKKVYYDLIESMLAGEIGNADLTGLIKRSDFWYFYAPIKKPGWSFAIRVNESDIFSSVYNRVWYSFLFFSLLLCFIVGAVFLVSGKFSNAVAWVIERCLRIERMNFHEAEKVESNIEEIRQLSRTLDRMCAALKSYFSVQEDVRIAKAIRQQTLPSKMRSPPGFQFLVWSTESKDSCGETYDSVDYWRSSYSHAKELLGMRPEGTAYLLLDTPDKGVDGAVKNTHLRAIFSSYAKMGVNLLDTVIYMNDYLQADLSLPGPVHAWFGVIDNENSVLSTVSLGLIKVLHYCFDGRKVDELKNYPFALSMLKELPELTLQYVPLQAGDMLCVLSEGIFGALNADRAQFGVGSLNQILIANSDKEIQAVMNEIVKSYRDFTQGHPMQADATIMLIRRMH